MHAGGNWTVGSETCVVDNLPGDPNAAAKRLEKRLANYRKKLAGARARQVATAQKSSLTSKLQQ